jgi:hypothetical protein
MFSAVIVICRVCGATSLAAPQTLQRILFVEKEIYLAKFDPMIRRFYLP